MLKDDYAIAAFGGLAMGLSVFAAASLLIFISHLC